MTDEPHENVDVFLAYALKLEQEAALRYDQLADSMGAADNRDAEKIFRKMSKFSQMHYAEARARSGYHDLPSLAPQDFNWPDFESPEAAAIWAADPLIAKDDALQIALDAERAAHEFYSRVLEKTVDPEVKALAREFAAEEGEHVQWMIRWIEEDRAKLPHEWVDDLQFHL
jgi:rubrerythrin